MSFQQVYQGGTFGPGQSFPEFCYFENCTFYAQCTFQEGCMFKNCTFLKCCPSYYTQSNSTVKQSILENCSLEYITVDSESLVVNCQKGLRAIVQAKENPEPKQLGTSEAFCIEYCCQPKLDVCRNTGVSVSPKESGAPEKKNVEAGCENCGEKKLGFEASK